MSFGFVHSLSSTVSGATAGYIAQQDEVALEEQVTEGVTQPASTQNYSFSDLTKIPLDPDKKKELQKLPDPIQEKLKSIFGNRVWSNIITESTEEKHSDRAISVKDAVKISQISENENIFNLSGEFPITLIPVTDKLSELSFLHEWLKNHGLLTTELGKVRRTLYEIVNKGRQSVTIEIAGKLNSVYNKHMEKNLFDFKSLRSEAIKDAKESQFSSTSKKRPKKHSKKRSRHELTSLKGDQPQRNVRQRKNTTRIDAPIEHLAIEADPVVPTKSSSFASFTTISIKDYKKDISNSPDKSKLRKALAKSNFGESKLHGILHGSTNSVSIIDAVRIHKIVGIIKFDEHLLVTLVCSPSPENLAIAEPQNLEDQKLITRISSNPPAFIMIQTAHKMNSLSDPNKPIFDIKSILSKAIKEAETIVEAENQAEEIQIETGSIQQQDNQHNAFLFQQEQHLPPMIQEEYDDFLSQQEQHLSHTIQEQYFDFQKTQYNADLIQQQNDQPEQNSVDLPQQGQYLQYNDHQREQPETVLPQDWSKQPEQVDDDQILELFGGIDQWWM